MPYATPAPLIEADPHPGATFQGPREGLLALAEPLRRAAWPPTGEVSAV